MEYKKEYNNYEIKFHQTILHKSTITKWSVKVGQVIFINESTKKLSFHYLLQLFYYHLKFQFE